MDFNYLFIFPPCYFALWDSKAHHRPAGESVSWFLETSLFFKTPFPGWISVSTSFVSFFIFYILSYLLLKSMGYLSGCLMSSASIQKLLCGICSAFKCSFNEFVGEKVVSPTYSSAILGLPLRRELWILPPQQALFPFCFRPRLQMELDWMLMCLFVFKSFLLQSSLLPFQYCPIDISFSE